ncbi:hypothetical protein [Isoptericola sp. BMS4]|uniref:hypothetical protein n=1 Tax=Isoptericola sp. BMS4 TaxID=2527875 RepID=UPI001420CA0A|nr:hypothetical protein [Isoptericola sp. BMS4]
MSHDDGHDGHGESTGRAAGDGPPDEAFDRLRAADPAERVRVREGVLRAAVDDILGAEPPAADGDPDEPAARAETAGAGAAEGAGAGTEGDELAARRRRRASWLAAAAVAVLAVGGGGYVLGTQAGEPDAVVPGSAEPAVVLGGAGDGAPERAGTLPGAADAGGDAAAATEPGAADMAYPGWYSGRAVFHARGLSTEAGEATAYGVDATGVATRDGAARVAAALGVDGEPRRDHGSWSVGPRDGGGPSVWLSADGTASFGYQDPSADPWRCGEVVEERGDAATSDGGTEPAGCAEPGGEAVTAGQAVDALREAMRSLGVDPAGFELEADETEDEPARWVTAHQVVDGRRTGAQWSATVGASGIAWLDGSLGSLVDLGDYPVVSPAAAVERLGDPRFAGSAWPITFAEGADVDRPVEEPTEPTPPPAPPAPGDPVRWPVSDVEITSARLGLTQQHQEDGAVLVVPAYELSDADGNVWSVLAVADEAVDFTAPSR